MDNRRNGKYSITIILAMIVCASLSGQVSKPIKPSSSGETLQLFSDRGIYCVSENILFSAAYRKPGEIGNEGWSSVLYAELIRWDGTKLAQSKIRIKEEYASGSLSIPENIKSGVYYLRVYTRWMRNYSPYLYSYLPLKIVNPHVREIDTGPENTAIGIHTEEWKESRITEDILYRGLKDSYGPRQLVEFEIDVSDAALTGPYCLSIAWLGSNEVDIASSAFSGWEDSMVKGEVEFLPETKYISLSGKMVNQQTRQPIKFEQVILTSTLDPFFFSVNTSGKDGDFLFLLPDYKGTHQFCLTTQSEYDAGVEFQVSNDFCNQQVSLPYIPFNLTDEEATLVKEIATNAQLYRKFHPVESQQTMEEDYYPFYGKAMEIIYIKDYIELLDLREFFFELVLNVSVDRKEGKSFLKLAQSGSFYTLPPLILLDNIPVRNSDELLGISTRKIDRIEVINGGYIIGKHMFSGIISIYSTNRDLAGLDLSSNYRYFNYQLFQNDENVFPSFDSPDSKRNAEMLNTLYWQPNIKLSKENSAKIRFYTTDALGRYSVTLKRIGVDESFIQFNQAEFSVTQ